MHTAIAIAAGIGALIAFVIASAPAIHRGARRAYTRAADTLGRYTRLTCPHCPRTIRYRGVETAEDEQLRQRMADHIASH